MEMGCGMWRAERNTVCPIEKIVVDGTGGSVLMCVRAEAEWAGLGLGCAVVHPELHDP